LQVHTLPPPSTVPMIDLDDRHIEMLPEPETRCRVLVVDDDELVLARIAALVRLGGYETHTATCGNSALRLLEKIPCQIVLTDWDMPTMNGLALCNTLRARDEDGYVYLMLLTVRNDGQDVATGLGAGADDYVIKGAAPQELLARIGVGRRITLLEQTLRASNHLHRRMSTTDSLTGIRNRRFLMQYLPQEMERSRRNGNPLAVLSCDIDHFKTVNDTFGHEAGDEVLQGFVKAISGCIRNTVDWIARSGGEEFVVVLPETDLSGATSVAERIRQSLECEAIRTSFGPCPITVSAGVSALETECELSEDAVLALLRSADEGLYASKRLGRNRVTPIVMRSSPHNRERLS
jgi:two-component system cell cycle response regulator